MAEVTVGIGMAPAELTLELGDLHPSGHGALRLACQVEDGVVTAADPQPGLLHRGTEKLLEVRDYRQALMLANRHDWLSAVTSEVALALAVEELLGLEPPPRATWLRTVLCEINRAAAALLHAAGAASLPPRGSPPDHAPGMRAREALQGCLESISGGRVHAMITRIGGLAHDAPAGWADDVVAALEVVRAELPELRDAVARTIPPGLAVLTPDEAVDYGTSGPVARASGLELDARRDHPYLAYAEVAQSIRVAMASDGDALTRYLVLLDQVEADLPLVLALLERLPEGPVNVPLPKVVRAPEGSAYSVVESATGRSGAYVVSVGETTPWRVRLRTPSYAHAQAMTAGLPGTPVSELAAAIGSFMCVAGDTDH